MVRPDTNVKPTMYAADVANIAAGATYSTPSQAISVAGLDWITLWLKATGHAAGSAGNITFNLVFSGDGTTYSTVVTPYVVPVAGTAAAVSAPILLDVRGINALKVLSIINGDAGQQVDSLNVLLTNVKT